MQELATVHDIISELGGPTAVSRSLKTTPQAVCNWKASKRFPAERYLVLTAELKRRGFSAPASLFGMQDENA